MDPRPLLGILVRASFWYAKVVGLIFHQGTYKNQSMNVSVSGTTNGLFVSPPLTLKSVNLKKWTSSLSLCHPSMFATVGIRSKPIDSIEHFFLLVF